MNPLLQSTLPGKRNSESFLRLLTPTQALGCRADLVILCHLDSESWNLTNEIIVNLNPPIAQAGSVHVARGSDLIHLIYLVFVMIHFFYFFL